MRNPIGLDPTSFHLRMDETGPFDGLLHETLFSLSNGKFGIRGFYAESPQLDPEPAKSIRGTYHNGFFENVPILYGEDAYGFARINETMLNIPDCLFLQLWVGEEPLDVQTGKVWEQSRHLDLMQGVLTRNLRWQSPSGKQISLESQRIVSLALPDFGCLRLVLRSENYDGPVTILSGIQGNVRNVEAKEDPRIGTRMTGLGLQPRCTGHRGEIGFTEMQTIASEQTLLSAFLHHFHGKQLLKTGWEKTPYTILEKVEFHIQQGDDFRLEKSFGHLANPGNVRQVDEKETFFQTLDALSKKGFSFFLDSQAEFLRAFWDDSAISITGDKSTEQGLLFNQFHLLQAAGRDGKTGTCAKGLTGEGYGGHYFWDTEIFILPFFLHTRPSIARKLLEYRISTLPKARERARTLSHPNGALFPWRTISGEECSGYFPAGTAQYHINADIAFAVQKYVEATGDNDLLQEGGAEMVWETARIWMDVGHFSPARGGAFCIDDITGPDEYTALVNNNTYTNLMAQNHLRYAHRLCEVFRTQFPRQWESICARIQLSERETQEWLQAAQKMYFPRSDSLGVTPQDDSFLYKKKWDLSRIPREKFPLLLHFHPLVIYRHQVLKQADVILAQWLFPGAFSAEQKHRDFSYYEPITTHDSSLSSCIYSILASEIGNHQKAFALFQDAVRMDLDNRHQNSQNGVHTAAMAGSWLAVVFGFGGARTSDGELAFSPRIPATWKSFSFPFLFQGSKLRVQVEHGQVHYTLENGKALSFSHEGKSLCLHPGQSVTLPGPEMLQREERKSKS